jgi:hypothetical protein
MTARVYQRRFDWDEARRLRSDGRTYAQIARRCGVSHTAVLRVLNDDRQAERVRLAARQRGGMCVDCGREISRNTSRPVLRCVPCWALSITTTVRDGEIRCVGCHEWKPDNEFPRNRAKGRVMARGRHSSCRSCLTVARREYRERHKVPCVGCGRPALPANEKGKRGGSVPRCRSCFHADMRARRGLDDTPGIIPGGVVEPDGSQVASDQVASLECAGSLSPRDATGSASTHSSLPSTPSPTNSGLPADPDGVLRGRPAGRSLP